ncbi:MAG: hypothetical protein IKU08_06595 [Clostridia bacterium]|nr:hypothetical protein [Clostridia bacterium]
MGNTHDMSNEKRSLKDKLLAIVLLEASKPYKEMDSDLVTECVDFLMELEGKERLTKSKIEQRVNNIPFIATDNIYTKAKKRFRLKTLAVIAAILAILFAIFAVVSVATSYDPVMNLLKEISHTITEMFDGESVDVGGVTINKHGESIEYASLEELLEKENIDILYPAWLPDNEEITSVWFIDDVHSDYYIFKCENSTYSINVTLNESVPDEEKANLISKEINGLSIYCKYNDMNNYFQADFEYNGMLYSISTYTEEDLFKIIENLKEIE